MGLLVLSKAFYKRILNLWNLTEKRRYKKKKRKKEKDLFLRDFRNCHPTNFSQLCHKGTAVQATTIQDLLLETDRDGPFGKLDLARKSGEGKESKLKKIYFSYVSMEVSEAKFILLLLNLKTNLKYLASLLRFKPDTQSGTSFFPLGSQFPMGCVDRSFCLPWSLSHSRSK